MNKRLIRFDWAIKKLLRNKANFVILEGFLSELLFEEIKIENILESESNKETENDKYNRVDILCKDKKGELIIIEIQNNFEIDYFHRMVYAASKTIAENMFEGDDYIEIKKVISINIVYFDLGTGLDYIYKGGTIFEGLHKHDKLKLSSEQMDVFQKNMIADIFPEYYIIKVNKFNDIPNDTLDEWVYFLKNSTIKDGFSAKGLFEAKKVLSVMELPDNQLYGYNRYLDYLHQKAGELFNKRMELVELNRKAREQVIEEIKEEMREEVKGELREEVKGEVKLELREEVKGELREEVKGEVKLELREEVKGELREEVKGEVKLELREEVKGEISLHEKRDISLRLIKQGLNDELIAVVTLLGLDEIKEIRQNYNKFV